MEGKTKFSRYKILNVIGKGSFSIVYKAIDLEKSASSKEDSYVAIKVIDMNCPKWSTLNKKIDDSSKKPQSCDNAELINKKKQLLREIEISQNVHHPNIVEFFNVFHEELDEDKTPVNIYYLIMEYFPKGSLLDYLKKKGKCLTEKKACHFFKQMVSAVSYLHSKNIIHRDIKFENFVIVDEDLIKLIDFGFSIQSSPNSKSDELKEEYEIVNQNDHLRGTFCGSLAYSSPEIILHARYSYSIDIWSLGIVLFGMVFGTLPFQGKGEVLTNEILTSNTYFPKPISPELKGLITSMLRKNPKHRLTIEQVEHHEWLSKFGNSNRISSNNSELTLNTFENNDSNSNQFYNLDNDEFLLDTNTDNYFLDAKPRNPKKGCTINSNIFLNHIQRYSMPNGNPFSLPNINASVSHQNLPKYISTHLPSNSSIINSDLLPQFESKSSTDQYMKTSSTSQLSFNPFLILDEKENGKNNQSVNTQPKNIFNININHTSKSKSALSKFTNNDDNQSSTNCLSKNDGDFRNESSTNHKASNVFLGSNKSRLLLKPSKPLISQAKSEMMLKKSFNANDFLTSANKSKQKNPFIHDTSYNDDGQDKQISSLSADKEKSVVKNYQFVNSSTSLTFK